MLSMKSFKEYIGDSSGASPIEQVQVSSGCMFPEALPRFDEIKYLLAEEALKRADGNYTRAAELLGTTRQSVMRHTKKRREK